GGSVSVAPFARHSEVAARVELLHPSQEVHVDRHQILATAVPGAILHHPDLAVALDDPRLDLTRLPVDEELPVALPRHDLLAHLLHALRTERVGLTRKAELRTGALVALQERRGGP